MINLETDSLMIEGNIPFTLDYELAQSHCLDTEVFAFQGAKSSTRKVLYKLIFKKQHGSFNMFEHSLSKHEREVMVQDLTKVKVVSVEELKAHVLITLETVEDEE